MAGRAAVRSAVALALIVLAGLAWFSLRQVGVGTRPLEPPAPAPVPAPPPPATYPDYAPKEKVLGRIRTVGSDTMNLHMTRWAEGFRRYHPYFEFEIQGKGSSTAPPALIAGTAQFGPMAREMKPKEVEDFRRKFGHGPTALATSIDLLAVFVHRDNPLQGMTMQQVDAVFSKSRQGGFEKGIHTWGGLGLTGEWADKPISLYGRNPASGTWGFFKDRALILGEFKDSVKEQPGSASVVQSVAGDRYGIGYAGIGYRTAAVKALPLSGGIGRPFVEADLANACSGNYPLSRFLWLYVNYEPGTPLDPLRREFLRYVFSKQGQEDVVKDGYYPLPATLAREQLGKVGL